MCVYIVQRHVIHGPDIKWRVRERTRENEREKERKREKEREREREKELMRNAGRHPVIVEVPTDLLLIHNECSAAHW